MKQDILKFNFKFKSKEFFVTEKNIFAYDFINKWPNWEQQFVYIYGPIKCGKTSIAKLWKEKCNAIYVSIENFDKLLPKDLDIDYIKNNNWILDDVDKLINNENDYISTKILNLINIMKDNANACLLMTATNAPKYIGCDLEDLTSRLSSSIVLEISNPDQELIYKIIDKYLNDRNIYLSKRNLKYISDRVERSYESALKIAQKIDLHSLETKSKISMYFLRSLFDN